MKVRVKAPGSCGELVQGKIDGVNFLVTCPIDLYSEVMIIGNKGQGTAIGSKAAAAVEKTLDYLQMKKQELALHITTQMPFGKGMASSSADISAVCQAVALSLGRRLTAHEIADIALKIEPTDGIFYTGIAMFDHVRGEIRRMLGEPPPMVIAIFDTGGEVDTLSFNRRQDLPRLNAEKESEVRKALALITEGINRQDAALIGRAATISAVANQRLLYKPSLDRIIEIALASGAVGVNIAHSGTVTGVLFPAGQLQQLDACIENVVKYCNVVFLKTVRLISGGVLIQKGDTNEWEKCL